MTVRTRVAAALVGATVLVLGVGSTAQAQGIYTPPTTSTTVTAPTGPSEQPVQGGRVTVVRGETVDVDGQGCAPGEAVVVSYDDGSVLGTFTADGSGTFLATITIPLESTLGDHVLTATCGELEQYLAILVLAERVDVVGTINDGSLPRSGSTVAPLAGIGAAVLVLGAALVYGARRPRSA